MKKDNQQQWAEWASRFHEKEATADNRIDNNGDQKDFEAVQKIYKLKPRVNQALRLESAEQAWTKVSGQLTQRSIRLAFLRYAAIFIVSLLLTGSAFWVFDRGRSHSAELACITSPKGQITNITLFDGTNIWLNAGSTIKYNHAFNTRNREIILDGEALFSVTKNKKLPFIVKAGEAKVKVYGTEFNVKAYSNESKIETVLIEGKVEFQSDKGSVTMQPGEFLSYAKSNGHIKKLSVSPADYTSWKGGKIYYDNEKLITITRQLERWYEVKFKFAHENIQSYRFTGVINKSKSLEYVLNLIQEINKVKFEIDNEYILIKE